MLPVLSYFEKALCLFFQYCFLFSFFYFINVKYFNIQLRSTVYIPLSESAKC